MGKILPQSGREIHTRLSEWNDEEGIMEYWNVGMMGKKQMTDGR
jgi:hypothetical protein